jgi:hypothetical protein
MIMRTWFFLLLFLWGMLWTGADSARAAAYQPWNVSLMADEGRSSEGQIFDGIRTIGDPTIPPLFSPGSWQVSESKGGYALPDEGEKPLSDASRKEHGEPQRDWKGIGKDAAYFVGYQAVFAGVLYVLPESVTKWTDEQKRTTVNKWAENVQSATWDNDPLWVNYLGHPYFGACYYIRARERGFGEFSSFWWSAAFSAMYEYGIEAFFEPPSYQDLIVTPVGGMLVGKFIFEPIRDSIKAKKELVWSDHLLLVLTDPLGAANGFVDRMFGVKSDIRLIGAPSTLLRANQSSYRTVGSLKRQDETRFRLHGVGVRLDVTW